MYELFILWIGVVIGTGITAIVACRSIDRLGRNLEK